MCHLGFGSDSVTVAGAAPQKMAASLDELDAIQTVTSWELREATTTGDTILPNVVRLQRL